MRMDRLTFEGNFCDISQCEATPGGSFCEDGACDTKKVWEKLKKYEDIGLSPEGVKNARDYVLGRTLVEVSEYDGFPAWRLREFTTAEREGRLLILPCKVGDTGYWTLGAKITECRVYRIQITNGGIDVFVKNDDLPETPCIGLTYGENLFLTREEAENALEVKKDG